MSKRLDAKTPVKYGEDKTFWMKIGTAFENRGGGWDVLLDAMPAAALDNKGNMKFKIFLFPPKEKDVQRDGPPPETVEEMQRNSPDDEIPF